MAATTVERTFSAIESNSPALSCARRQCAGRRCAATVGATTVGATTVGATTVCDRTALAGRRAVRKKGTVDPFQTVRRSRESGPASPEKCRSQATTAPPSRALRRRGPARRSLAPKDAAKRSESKRRTRNRGSHGSSRAARGAVSMHDAAKYAASENCRTVLNPDAPEPYYQTSMARLGVGPKRHRRDHHPTKTPTNSLKRGSLGKGQSSRTTSDGRYRGGGKSGLGRCG
jgi:hypothetical protein